MDFMKHCFSAYFQWFRKSFWIVTFDILRNYCLTQLLGFLEKSLDII